MVVNRGLLLKGLGVCALCVGGAVTIHFKGREIKDLFLGHQNIEVRKIEVAGLECEEGEGGECSIKTGEKVFVKRGDGANFELTTLGEGSGKIKRYKDSDYEGGFKFLIEDNDINGTSENNKLEEFETYEVKKGGEGEAGLKGKEYLFRKTDSKAEIKKALGLGCDLPDATTDNCTITDNKVGSVTNSGGTVTLAISKETDKEDYPLGYKFTFKNTHTSEAATLTYGDKTVNLKNSSPVDFKIKKSGSSLSLEKAWTLESLSKKVGIECGKDGYCSPKEGGEIFVKKGSENHFKVSSLGEGKIKVYEVEGEDYNENLKFSIEEKEIAGPNTNKLEEFESYEIKKGGSSDADLNGKYYFSRKADVKTGIKKSLGLPNDNCNLPTNGDSQECSNIGNKVGSLTITGGTVTLNISKETDFPLGYKFTFKNTHASENATLTTIEKETVTLKKNSPVEFKIKKEGSSLSLEKAWTLEELAKKVGMDKQADGYWFVGGSGMNIKLGSTKKTKLPKYGSPEGRIKVYSDQEEYSEGLKFTIEKGDLILKEDTASSTVQHLLGQFQSFEVVKEENTWYLSKKEGDEAKVKELLGLPKDSCDLPTETATPKDCTLSGENIKKIKFDGLGSGTTATLTGTPKLTIHKDSGRDNFPVGYKFVFSADSGSSITIPSSSSSTPSITVKKDLSYEYKIKRSGENNQTITLERAWTPEVLMSGFGAAGFAKSINNEWSEEGEDGISIKQDNDTASSAKTTGTKKAKIRVYEGTPGYNQGMKFVVEEGDTDLTNGGNNIKKLTKYETYEVSKDSDTNWYFKRKRKSEESIRELLGLPSTCSMPTTTECDLDDSALKAIKFEGKGDSEITVTGSGSVKLKITKETSDSYPLGYKFTFEEGGFTIPQGSSSSITVGNNSNTEFKIKEGDKSNLTLVKVG